MTRRLVLASRLRDERGSVLMLVAASLVVFVLCAAFVVDIGNARQVARNYQNAADGASLAGAQGLPDSALGSPPMAWDFAAGYAFQTLGVSGWAEGICSDPRFGGEVPSGPGVPHCYADAQAGVRVYVTTPWNDSPTDPDWWALPDTHKINVKICGEVATGFSRIVGINLIQPCRLATAMSAPGTGPCAVCILEPDAQGAFTMSGTGSATVTGSGTWINSGHSTEAARNPGGGIFASAGFYVRGGATGFNPAPTQGAPKIGDPAAWLPDPRSLQATGWPDWTTLPFRGKEDVMCTLGPDVADTVTVDYGIWTSISANDQGPNTCDGKDTIRLNPGFYVIREEFDINTDANVVANLPGVTIYFACNNFPENPCGLGQHAYFDHSGTGDLDLHASTAPAGHPYNNLLFFFDRSNQTQLNRISGGGFTTRLTGTIYAPRAGFELSGSGVYNSLFVVGTMELTGNGSLDIIYNPAEQVPTYLPALIT